MKPIDGSGTHSGLTPGAEIYTEPIRLAMIESGIEPFTRSPAIGGLSRSFIDLNTMGRSPFFLFCTYRSFIHNVLI
jgi:hypothetical protein